MTDSLSNLIIMIRNALKIKCESPLLVGIGYNVIYIGR